uniref:uroplakin-1b-like n=1 Tax=Myxine glutinosa TaxID=7769 RepID=UPI00358F471A
MAQGPITSCIQRFLVFGNFALACMGVVLFALGVYVVSDPWGIRPILDNTHTDHTGSASIFAAGWIAVFTGLAFLFLGILGMVAAFNYSRILLFIYIICAIVVFIFEMTSCILAATQRDYLGPEFFLKHMLDKYQGVNADKDFTSSWNTIMQKHSCCGVNGPEDWISYTSKYRDEGHAMENFPWPRQCCNEDVEGNIPGSKEACILGEQASVTSQGCLPFIKGPLDRNALRLAWYGFCVLCWEFLVVLGMMYLFSTFSIL